MAIDGYVVIEYVNKSGFEELADRFFLGLGYLPIFKVLKRLIKLYFDK
ncbi:MAG: hypothetical protein IM631_21065 [Cytophagales bacterium]|jgi:hypothetical protein|nr:hypothetical protein [Cytophagales bacterium]MCA6374410.1 hypothetical protein [Cytophagales bacterium]MCA6384515.1 hypothetical protein [Cytophagales bacterium]